MENIKTFKLQNLKYKNVGIIQSYLYREIKKKSNIILKSRDISFRSGLRDAASPAITRSFFSSHFRVSDKLDIFLFFLYDDREREGVSRS